MRLHKAFWRNNFALFCLLILASCLASCDDSSANDEQLAAKEPSFFGNTYIQKTNKPIIFNVWATWCTPCVKEMPQLEALAAEGYYDVYALSIDRQKSAADKFWQKADYKHIKMLHDPSGKAFYEAYAGYPIPVTFILDEGGVVHGVEKGEREWSHPDMKSKIFETLHPNMK